MEYIEGTLAKEPEEKTYFSKKTNKDQTMVKSYMRCDMLDFKEGASTLVNIACFSNSTQAQLLQFRSGDRIRVYCQGVDSRIHEGKTYYDAKSISKIESVNDAPSVSDPNISHILLRLDKIEAKLGMLTVGSKLKEAKLESIDLDKIPF